MKKILIISNDSSYTYRFRKELIEFLSLNNFSIVLVCNFSNHLNELKNLGITLKESYIDKRGKSFLNDFKLLIEYLSLIKKYKPDIILSYTIKPNIYGGIASKITRTKIISNITGLGSALARKTLLQQFILFLYRIALNNTEMIFFQNSENMDFLLKNKVKPKSSFLIPGSGVNLDEYKYLSYPPDNNSILFLFMGRIMKEKGILLYLEAAKIIKSKYPNTKFNVIGGFEENLKDIIDQFDKEKIINYFGKQNDPIPFIKESNCIINPTYYPEGISNVLLEAAASGRPLIASNRSGCKEVINDGYNGYLFENKNLFDLVNKIETFIGLTYNDKKLMGLNSRIKVKNEFNRTRIIDAYEKAIFNSLEDKQ